MTTAFTLIIFIHWPMPMGDQERWIINFPSYKSCEAEARRQMDRYDAMGALKHEMMCVEQK